MTAPTGTVIHDLPIGEYHQLERLSPSGMSALLRSPAHYQEARRSWATREPSKALRIGSAVHTLVLEPEKARTMLPAAPDVNRRTKQGREEYEAWRNSVHPDAILLNEDEQLIARHAAGAVLSHPGIQAAGLLKGQAEVSILWDEDGAPCKARPDLITERGFVVDLKTSADASDFERSVANYGYARQAAWLQLACLRAGIECKAVVFVVVETSAPYGVRTVTLDQVASLQGEREYQRALAVYRRCTETGDWPCYEPGLDTISLPVWCLDVEE